MLQQIVRKKVIDAALILDNNKINLSPKNGSPLEMLVSLGKQMTYKGEKISLESFNEVPLADGIDLFNIKLNELTKEISEALNKQIVFARTQVKPIIKELLEKVDNEVKKRLTNVELDVKIKKEELPLPLQLDIFLDLISEDLKYNPIEYKFSKITFNNSKEELQKINLLDLLKTNNPVIDGAFLSFIENNNLLMELNAAFESMYYDKDGNVLTIANPNTLLSLDLDDYTRLKNAIYFYFISLAIQDNPIQGSVGDMQEYKKYFFHLKVLCSSIFKKALDRFQRYNKNDTLIKEIDVKTNTITVIGSTYEKFLESGGSELALIGYYYLNKDKAFFAKCKEILDSLDTLIKAYESKIRLIMETNKRNEIYIKKDSLINIINDFLYETFAVKGLNEFLAQNEIYNKTINNPDYMFFKQKSKELILNVRDNEFSDLANVITFVLCKGLFYKTEAYDILMGIENAKNLNPEIENNREAALLSVFNYITKFVFNQIDVK